MLGAICGDIIGSMHEFHNTRSKDFPLFSYGNTMTDDTVCTIAVADCFLNDSEEFDVYLRKYCSENIHAGYGGMFKKWIADPSIGPYESWGNGGAMRVSSVAYVTIGKTIEEAMDLAKKTCDVTHNHPEAIKGAQAIVLAMRFAMNGHHPENIRSIIRDEFDFDYNMDLSVSDIFDNYTGFDVSARGTVPQAIICAVESTSYEDAIRNAVSIGGDSDTIACMAGSIAEIMHGIPDDIKINATKHLPAKYIEVIDEFTKRYIGSINERY